MAVAMVFSEEQEELRGMVRRFCESRSPSPEVRRLMATDDGYSPEVWELMASQLGLQGLAIPERFGGAGFSHVEQAIVLEEMGRVLLCAPYLASVIAVNALLESGDEDACAAFLPSIASGARIVTLALAEDSGRWEEDAVTLNAERSDQGGSSLPTMAAGCWTATSPSCSMAASRTWSWWRAAPGVGFHCSRWRVRQKGCRGPRCRPSTRPASWLAWSSHARRLGSSAPRVRAGRG